MLHAEEATATVGSTSDSTSDNPLSRSTRFVTGKKNSTSSAQLQVKFEMYLPRATTSHPWDALSSKIPRSQDSSQKSHLIVHPRSGIVEPIVDVPVPPNSGTHCLWITSKIILRMVAEL